MKELDGGTEDGRTDKDAELLEILVLKRKMFSKYKAPMASIMMLLDSHQFQS